MSFFSNRIFFFWRVNIYLQMIQSDFFEWTKINHWCFVNLYIFLNIKESKTTVTNLIGVKNESWWATGGVRHWLTANWLLTASSNTQWNRRHQPGAVAFHLPQLCRCRRAAIQGVFWKIYTFRWSIVVIMYLLRWP